MYRYILWTHQRFNHPAVAEAAAPRRSLGCGSGAQLRPTGMSKPKEKKVRAAGKSCQGRGQVRILPVPVHALPCPRGNADGCHPIQVKLQGTTNPKDSPFLRAVPAHCLPSNPWLSRAWRSGNVDDKEKQSPRAVRAPRVISVDESFQPGRCQLAQLHPQGWPGNYAIVWPCKEACWPCWKLLRHSLTKARAAKLCLSGRALGDNSLWFCASPSKFSIAYKKSGTRKYSWDKWMDTNQNAKCPTDV